MVSNITLLYIHLRLSEIYDTGNCDDGWFGKINILTFGDLLQLPPVNELSPFLPMQAKKCDKYINALGTINLWEKRTIQRKVAERFYRYTLNNPLGGRTYSPLLLFYFSPV